MTGSSVVLARSAPGHGPRAQGEKMKTKGASSSDVIGVPVFP